MTRFAYFKAYDLRGTDADVAWRLGRALPAWAAAAEFVLGRDARLIDSGVEQVYYGRGLEKLDRALGVSLQ